MANRLGPGEQLNSGESLYSRNGNFRLHMQGTDGNLVLYAPGNIATWASGTTGHPGSIVRMQRDGNLVVIAPGNHPKFDTNTNGERGCVLDLQNDGNLVVYATGHRSVWSSGTYLRNFKLETIGPGRISPNGTSLEVKNGTNQNMTVEAGQVAVTVPPDRYVNFEPEGSGQVALEVSATSKNKVIVVGTINVSESAIPAGYGIDRTLTPNGEIELRLFPLVDE